MPSSADSLSLDAMARSLLTHDHTPVVERPATPSTDASSVEEVSASLPLHSTIFTDLVGQLSALGDPGIRTIDTNYDPSNEANAFRYRAKSMEERHGPTERHRKAACKAARSKTFNAFQKKVSRSYMRIKT